MPFDQLPQHNIQYPVTHFASIPARQPIPIARHVAETMKQIAQIIKDASPEEREKHMIALKLARSHLAGVNLQQEMQQFRLDQLRKSAAEDDLYKQDLDEGFDKAFRGGKGAPLDTELSKGPSVPVGDINTTTNEHLALVGPEPPDLGDTNPAEYYGLA